MPITYRYTETYVDTTGRSGTRFHAVTYDVYFGIRDVIKE